MRRDTRELMDLLTLPSLTAEQVQTITLAKLEFGGKSLRAGPP